MKETEQEIYERISNELNLPKIPSITFIFTISRRDLLLLLKMTEYALMKLNTVLIESLSKRQNKELQYSLAKSISHIFSYRTTIISQLDYMYTQDK